MAGCPGLNECPCAYVGFVGKTVALKVGSRLCFRSHGFHDELGVHPRGSGEPLKLLRKVVRGTCPHSSKVMPAVTGKTNERALGPEAIEPREAPRQQAASALLWRN